MARFIKRSAWRAIKPVRPAAIHRGLTLCVSLSSQATTSCTILAMQPCYELLYCASQRILKMLRYRF